MDVIEYWRARAALKQGVREFFGARDYLEIDTPIAVKCPGTEVHLEYFETAWRDYDGRKYPLFLRSSPELHMKQILATGCERIFQMAPCFRNGGELSEWHQPEFTMLEWYGLGQSYTGIIDQTEELLRETHRFMRQKFPALVRDILPAKFERISVFDAFERFAGIELTDQDPKLAALAIQSGVVSCQPKDDFETAYFKILIEKIEPEIARKRGVVLMDYPPSQAALAAVDHGRAQRFEFYLGRVELCNGFFELIGESQNRQRVGEAMSERAKLGKQPVPEDEEFYRAMGRIKKPCAGNALGFDRWLALVCDENNLDHVIPLRRSGVFCG